MIQYFGVLVGCRGTRPSEFGGYLVAKLYCKADIAMEVLHKNISDTKMIKHLTPLILIAFNMKKRAKNVVLLKTPIKYCLEYGIHFFFFFGV